MKSTGRPAHSMRSRSNQLSRLRRWGTVGALLLMLGAGSSYGSASPIPNPVDGLRIIGLLSRIGPAALACSYTGIGLIVLSWVLIGRLALPGRPRRLSRSQLSHTLAMWAVPLLVTPPLFSRDVYSYLAIGSMMAHGFNPYESGPYDTLGDADPYAHQVDVRWQHTASPYGPVYLLIARGIVTVAARQSDRGRSTATADRARRGRADRLGAAAVGPDLRFRPGGRTVARRAEPPGAVPPDRRRPQRGADARRDAGRDRDRLAAVGRWRRRADHPRRGHQGHRRNGPGLPGDHAGAAGRGAVA